jgi:protein prenyltransferase alpha subunit repeat containing protein 1
MDKSRQEDFVPTERLTCTQMNQEQGDASAPLEALHYDISAEYVDLVAALNSTVSKGLYNFDILPDSHSLPSGLKVLVDDFTISIPKKTLKNAFITARHIFFDNVDSLTVLAQSQDLVLDSSAVILLLAPEYLTAVNARKRVIMAWEKESEEKGTQRIVMELWMLDSMFMSPLHKHTKSPTLWAHRRWLLQRLSVPEPPQMERKSPMSALRKEREISLVALTAAQHHPRNYYAWNHMRWWISYHPDLLENFGHCPVSQLSPNKPPFGLPKLAQTIQEWCLSHPSDTSGWSFLLWLLTVPNSSTSQRIHLHGPFSTVGTTVLWQTKSFKLRNEALWVFLRTLMASEQMPAKITQMLLEDAQAISESETEWPQSKVVAKRTIRWLGRYKHGEHENVDD